jgi:hypothetical protein
MKGVVALFVFSMQLKRPNEYDVTNYIVAHIEQRTLG